VDADSNHPSAKVNGRTEARPDGNLLVVSTANLVPPAPAKATELELDALVLRLLEEHPPSTTPDDVFLGARFDLGLAWVSFPVGLGGLGLAPGYQAQVEGTLAEADAPVPMLANPIGVGMAAPTVLAHGSDAQRSRYLRPLFTGEEVWCQLFSEPSAGSDLAALATRARRDGDEWVVDGQKVWTSLAHKARWALLLARSDPDVPKHRGLTYFVLDMHAPGVEVRPLRQLTGEAEFNEVFLNGARIPDAERLGDVGDGWRVAMTTLMNERVSIGDRRAPRGWGYIGRAVDLYKARPAGDVPGSGAVKDRLMQLWVRVEVNRLTNLRAAQGRAQGVPGPEGSVAKLEYAELNQAVTELCLHLMGPAGTIYGSYDLMGWRPHTLDQREPANAFLRSQANSIEGGTSNILRNILAERVLGLPTEPRVDKDLPWSEVRRA
jgi:alkylation response protein AidB-like acyl-CoA dehydrogenase